MRSLICALLVATPFLFGAQEQKVRWQRIYSGDDSFIEMESTKVTFGSPSIGRVRFRTIYSKPQALDEKALSYKTRVETIEFKCELNSLENEWHPINATRYRLFEGALLDTSGRAIKKLDWDPSVDWKEVRFGTMMEKLSIPACKLIQEKTKRR